MKNSGVSEPGPQFRQPGFQRLSQIPPEAWRFFQAGKKDPDLRVCPPVQCPGREIFPQDGLALLRKPSVSLRCGEKKTVVWSSRGRVHHRNRFGSSGCQNRPARPSKRRYPDDCESGGSVCGRQFVLMNKCPGEFSSSGVL